MLFHNLHSYQRQSNRLLDEISAFVQQEASRAFLKLLFTKDERIARIEEYHQRISTTVTTFQASRGISNRFME
jgi:Trp operon repressor